jgi:hypothetical protein
MANNDEGNDEGLVDEYFDVVTKLMCCDFLESQFHNLNSPENLIMKNHFLEIINHGWMPPIQIIHSITYYITTSTIARNAENGIGIYRLKDSPCPQSVFFFLFFFVFTYRRAYFAI